MSIINNTEVKHDRPKIFIYLGYKKVRSSVDRKILCLDGSRDLHECRHDMRD
ncbi:hypothetical protein [Nitrososphaera sp. AFS]|uniref:hypothetical protein n=1 Tax=Nitrososphaera sp. AFS TaxID=2301191 RepID=UPI0019176C58|nr:hypothetical protein [Nitrososphaera sp. AFS]